MALNRIVAVLYMVDNLIDMICGELGCLIANSTSTRLKLCQEVPKVVSGVLGDNEVIAEYHFV